MDEATKDVHRLQAISMAIWIRDHAKAISQTALLEKMQEIAEYELFSNRQLAKISGNAVSHVTIGNFAPKTSKSGGRLEPKTLDDIREILFSKNRGRTNYKIVVDVVNSGTSQGMVSKLTGINQSTISKKCGGNIESIETTI